MIIADTDVLIDYAHAVEPGATWVARELRTGRLATTAVNVFELAAGARTTRQRHALDDLLAAMEVMPLDQAVAMRAGAIHRSLAASGATLGMPDCLVAATCIARDVPLMTRNQRHFRRIEGLRLVGG